MQKENSNYDCYVKPFNTEISNSVIFKHLKFIGFDFIVDSADGAAYLLEGNATPYGFQLYQELYDFSLANNMQRMIKNIGKIGINIDLDVIKDLNSHKNRYANTKYITDLLEQVDVPYVLFSDDEFIKTGSGWKAKNVNFDFFWNRCFGIPDSYKRLSLDRQSDNILPTGPCIKLFDDKWETAMAVNNVIPTPLTYRADSRSEEVIAFEEISFLSKMKYGNKVTQKVLIKPLNDTGGNGIQFVDSVEEIQDHIYPSLVQERIIPELYDGRVVDLRVFFIDGWIANPIARVASERFNNCKVPLDKRLLTAICSGGTGIAVSNTVADGVSDYVLATAVKLEKVIQNED